MMNVAAGLLHRHYSVDRRICEHSLNPQVLLELLRDELTIKVV